MTNMIKKYITRIIENWMIDSIISCEKCKHLIKEKDAKKVQWYRTAIYYIYPWGNDYFCPSCAPTYDKVIDGRYYKTDVEVTEDGKIIKKN